MPAIAVIANLRRAATRFKLGMSIKRGALVIDDSKLIYPDPQSAQDRWEAECYHLCSVGIGRSKTDRCRPMFEEWSCEATYHYDPTVIEEEQILMILELAGNQVGLLDWRPEKGGIFGRFTATKIG